MKLKKILRNTFIVLLALVLVLLLGLFAGVTIKYWDYFGSSSGEFLIPGLMHNYVPQGFDRLEELDGYLMCGYMSDDTPSRVYYRDAEGKTKFSRLYQEDGSAYTKHAGGVCHNGDYVYLAGDDGVDVFALEDILEGRDAMMLGTIFTGHDMAFCSFEDGHLFAGNFYYPGHYETPESHRITTPTGDQNTSLITVFRADSEVPLGISPVPVAAISAQDKVQGMCFTDDGRVVLSISWSLTDSNLLFYRPDADRVGTLEMLETQVPLYYLDSANLEDTVILPPMSEELVWQDGKVWVMCESACNKYIFGKFVRGWQVFAYDPN